MRISASTLGSSLNEATTFLDNSYYLTEQESAYYPAMVLVRENSRLGLNLVRLEDLVDYSLANNITDYGYAINSVCEASNVDVGSIGLSVDEVSIIEDAEMADTVREFGNNGIPVYVAPLPSTDIACVMAEAVIDTCVEYDNADYLLEAYVDDDFETLLNENVITDKISSAYKTVKGAASNAYDKVANAISSAKNTSSKWISKKIASLKKTYRKYKEKAKNFASPKIDAICRKIKSAIEFLKSKLPGSGK